MSIKLADHIKLFTITDVHEHEDQYFEIIEKIKPDSSNIIVFLGDCIDKGFGLDSFAKITDSLIDLERRGCLYAIRGNHELKHIKNGRKTGLTPQLKWFDTKPLSYSFQWNNGHMVTCVHAGVTPKHTISNLENDVEVCYVRNIDEEGKMIPLIYKTDEEGNKILVAKKPGKIWHEIYDGRFGYIVSGHAAQKDGIPKYYNYSCNIDTACYETGILTCQPFTMKGREPFIQVTGKAANPQITPMKENAL